MNLFFCHQIKKTFMIENLPSKNNCVGNNNNYNNNNNNDDNN